MASLRRTNAGLTCSSNGDSKRRVDGYVCLDGSRLCIASSGNRLAGLASCGSTEFRAASSLDGEMLHPAVFSRRAASHGQILHRHKHRRRLDLPDDRMD